MFFRAQKKRNSRASTAFELRSYEMKLMLSNRAPTLKKSRKLNGKIVIHIGISFTFLEQNIFPYIDTNHTCHAMMKNINAVPNGKTFSESMAGKLAIEETELKKN